MSIHLTELKTCMGMMILTYKRCIFNYDLLGWLPLHLAVVIIEIIRYSNMCSYSPSQS